MKESELRKIIKEEIKSVLKEEYIETLNFGQKELTPLIVKYRTWEKQSIQNFGHAENSKGDEGWNTRDAKIEILEYILDTLNRVSKNKDKIKIL